MSERHERWMALAENDLAFARLGLSHDFHSQVCFISQQAAEKALKAALIHHAGQYPRVHSIVDLVQRNSDIEGFEELLEDARILDQYYIPTRYPDGVPGSLPGGLPSEKHARQALDIAERVVSLSRSVLP